jgi:integrase
MRVRSKTDAGARTIDLLPVLVDELLELRARSDDGPEALVFGTSTGAKQSPSNLRSRLFLPAVADASAALETVGAATPSGASDAALPAPDVHQPLLALGHEVPYVMEQAGHADATVTLAIYARVMRRTTREKARLKL